MPLRAPQRHVQIYSLVTLMCIVTFALATDARVDLLATCIAMVALATVACMDLLPLPPFPRLNLRLMHPQTVMVVLASLPDLTDPTFQPPGPTPPGSRLAIAFKSSPLVTPVPHTAAPLLTIAPALPLS